MRGIPCIFFKSIKNLQTKYYHFESHINPYNKCFDISMLLTVSSGINLLNSINERPISIPICKQSHYNTDFLKSPYFLDGFGDKK